MKRNAVIKSFTVAVLGLGLAVAAITAPNTLASSGPGGGGGGGGGGGTRTISANYSGDTNYTKSSGTTSITVQ